MWFLRRRNLLLAFPKLLIEVLDRWSSGHNLHGAILPLAPATNNLV
jgi:hypothetical protein